MNRRLLCLAAAVACAGCADSTAPQGPAASIAMADTVFIPEDDSVVLEATLLDSAGHVLPSAAMVWAIEDSTIASLGPGNVLRFGRVGATRGVVIAGGIVQRFTVVSAVRFSLMASGVDLRNFVRWCGVSTRGHVYCLGWEGPGDTVIGGYARLMAPASPLRTLSVGYEHVCGVAADATGWCWGYDGWGRLGSPPAGGSRLDSAREVQGGLQWRSIDAGRYHSCGVALMGAVYCWGLASASIGNGDSTSSGYWSSPQPVSLPLAADTVVAGARVSCALLVDSAIWCWGSNRYGALGLGSFNPGNAFQPMRVGSGYRSITASYESVCALDRDDTPACWGLNLWGQLGSRPDVDCEPPADFYRCSPVPLPVPGILDVTMISTGGMRDGFSAGHTCALKPNGTAWCWGANKYGEEGNGTTARVTSPVRVAGDLPFFNELTVGDNHACARATDGIVWCWGYGFGTTPTPIPFQH